MIKILYVVSGLGVNGGIEKYCMNVINNIDTSKFQIDFLVTSEQVESNEEYIKSKGSKIYHIKYYPSIFKRVKEKKNFFKNLKEQYDYVHVHTVLTTAYIWGKLAKKYTKAQVIFHSHTSGNYDGTTLKNKLCRGLLNRYADYKVGCSLSSCKFMFGKTDNCTILLNSADFSKFGFDSNSRNKIRNELNIPNDSRVICTVGRLTKSKNHKFVLDLLKELGNKYYYFIVGDGEQKEELASYVRENQISNVLFIGGVKNVPDYLSASDIFALPSFFEGLPTVLIEAQVNGLPVLYSSNITDEVIVSNNAVKLDLLSEDWLNAIKSLKGKDNDRKNIKLDEKLNKFSTKSVIKELENFYIEHQKAK